jgi:hypothetical protein
MVHWTVLDLHLHWKELVHMHWMVLERMHWMVMEFLRLVLVEEIGNKLGQMK